MNSRRASQLGVLASIFGAIAQLISFRVSIDTLGADLVSCWILLQSAFFLSRISESGTGVNLTRTLAASRASGNAYSVKNHLIAGVILILPAVFLIGVAVVPAAAYILQKVAPGTISNSDGFKLAVCSLLVSLLFALNTIAGSILEGGGQLVKKHSLSIFTAILSAASIAPFVTHFGIYGIPASTALSLGTSIIAALITQIVPANTAGSPTSVAIIQRIWRESLSTSGMALIRMGFEPLTKFTASAFGPLNSVAAIELAFRISTQVRILIQSAAQPLLYIGASKSKDLAEIMLTFGRATSWIVWANWTSTCLILGSAPLIIYLFYGQVSWLAIGSLTILTVGNAINSCGLTGYYLSASQGKMKHLLHIHVYMLLVNIALAPLLGYIFGSLGSVLAYSASLVLGGILLLHIWSTHSRIRKRRLIAAPNFGLYVALSLAIASLAGSYTINSTHIIFLSSIGFSILIVIAIGTTSYKTIIEISGRNPR